MNISSMTGFARSEGVFEQNGLNYAYVWEIKSVNAKGLDVKMRLPQGFDDMEFEVKNLVAQYFTRGTFNLFFDLKNQNSEANIVIDATLLEKLKNETVKIYQSDENVFSKPSPADLLSVFGVVTKQDDVFDEQTRRNLCAHILQTLKTALENLKKVRLAEGEKITASLIDILDQIDLKRQKVEEITAGSQLQIKEKILEQIKVLTTDANINPDRLEQEVLFYVMRADVKEELDRLKAHVLTAREIFSCGGAIGRRLDFLCQELNREANTLCSKSMDLEQTKIGMDLKALIEQFREQIQNME